MKKISVRKAVADYIKKEPNVTTSTVVKNVNKPANQIHTAIWKLVQDGVVNKDANGALTFNSTAEIKAGSIRKATGLEMGMGKKISVLEAQNAELQRLLHEAKVKYFDAMAVIKYLEAKLISVIK